MFVQQISEFQLSKDPSVAEVQQQLILRYGRPESDFALRESLQALERHFGRLAEISGKRVLDLGCGAVKGPAEINANPGTWAPWLPRAVAELGGKAVGVDIGFVGAEEKFEYHRVDLCRPNALGFLSGQTFDAINCSNLFSSPHLIFQMGMKDRETRAKLVRDLMAQSEKLLSPNGKFIEFDSNLDNW